MKLHLFDATPDSATPAEHGVLGPAHAADVTVDYEYQAELWVSAIGQDYPEIVRVECPDLGRTWVRDSGATMVEVEDAVITEIKLLSEAHCEACGSTSDVRNCPSVGPIDGNPDGPGLICQACLDELHCRGKGIEPRLEVD